MVVIVALPQGSHARCLRGRCRAWSERAGSRTAAAAAILRPAPRGHPPVSRVPAGMLLVLQDVRKHFGSLQVLDGIDFTRERGELLSLVGPERRRQDDAACAASPTAASAPAAAFC